MFKMRGTFAVYHTVSFKVVMAIDEIDVKKLWGLAAGRCSHPDCDIDCVQFFDTTDPTIIGEMAHVIARSENGPRGRTGGGNNTYANLILLCPTHHTIIDKAPSGHFPETLLFDWKARHEQRVRESLQPQVIADKAAMLREIGYLLAENYQVWKTFGPESDIAVRNPISSSAEIWTLRKLNRIVPNNRKIINIVMGNRDFLTAKEYSACCLFIEHAEGFEANCYVRREGVPRFPHAFQELINQNVTAQ